MATSTDAGRLAPIISRLRAQQDTPPPTSGLPKAAYLKPISGIVNFFRQHQNSQGQIIDPYFKKEIQYSTPCYAWAAAVLLKAKAGSDGLLESASRALEVSVQQLADANAADKHGDFFTFPAIQLLLSVPHHSDKAYEYLREMVPAETKQRWDTIIKAIDPWKAYQSHLRNDVTQNEAFTKQFSAAKMNNWNLVNVAGEFLRYQNNFVSSLEYVDSHLEEQLKNFTEDGLYIDPHGPMAYDLFPRYFIVTILERGYNGAHRAALEKLMERSVWASLLMQSPNGELPTGGRSSQHQWNDAQQCVTFEIWANRKAKQGDHWAASVLKRAAQISLAALLQWQRPTGELWIVKNRIDPAVRHSYEAYSFHSQYNLLAASMLATAWSHSDEAIVPKATLCELGGFAFELPFHHKIFANFSGMYLEIDTAAEGKYDSTGLIRVHTAWLAPLIGPSGVSGFETEPSAIGIGWPSHHHKWEYLSQFGEGSPISGKLIPDPKIEPDALRFAVRYSLGETLAAVHEVVEEYEVSKDAVHVSVHTVPAVQHLRVRFPAFKSDGEVASKIETHANHVRVSLNGTHQLFEVTSPASAHLVCVRNDVPYKNGYLQVYEAEVATSKVAYCIKATNERI